MRIRTPGYFAASFRQALMREGVVAKITSVFGGGLHGLLRRLARVDVVIYPNGNLIPHNRLQVLPSQIVGANPVAVLRTVLIDKSDVQVIREHRMEQTAENVGRGRVLRLLLFGFGADRNRIRGGKQLHIRPDRRHRFAQIRGAEAPELLKLINPQPHQQRVRCGNLQLIASLLPVGIPEVGEAGHKVLLLIRRPDMIRLKAQSRLKLGKAAGAAEIHPVKSGEPVGVHEVIIRPHRRIIGPCGNHPDYIAGDRGRVVAFQHADPLVALLHIKPAQVFKAPDGIPDALVPQMG